MAKTALLPTNEVGRLSSNKSPPAKPQRATQRTASQGQWPAKVPIQVETPMTNPPNRMALGWDCLVFWKEPTPRARAPEAAMTPSVRFPKKNPAAKGNATPNIPRTPPRGSNWDHSIRVVREANCRKKDGGWAWPGFAKKGSFLIFNIRAF